MASGASFSDPSGAESAHRSDPTHRIITLVASAARHSMLTAVILLSLGITVTKSGVWPMPSLRHQFMISQSLRSTPPSDPDTHRFYTALLGHPQPTGMERLAAHLDDHGGRRLRVPACRLRLGWRSLWQRPR